MSDALRFVFTKGCVNRRENFEDPKNNHQVPQIKPKTYERWKKRSFKKDISKMGEYGLKFGKRLLHLPYGKGTSARYIKKQKSKSGYEAKGTV